MCPSEWIATKTLRWQLGGHIVFMITYILCLFYFCTIWAVWVLWITYEKSLQFILCYLLRAWWRLFGSLVSPMCTTKPVWWYLRWYLWGHTAFMIIYTYYIYTYTYIYMMHNNIHDGYTYTKTCKEQWRVNKSIKISE